MNKASRIVVGAVGFAFGAWIVNAGLDAWRDRRAGARAGEAIDQMQRSAAKKKGGAAVNATDLQAEAIEQTAKKLADEPDAAKRRLTAASNFMGFYFVNVRARLAHCRALGVELNRFPVQFRRQHQDEIARAQEILDAAKLSEDRLYETTKDQLQRLVKLDMNDIATGANTDAKGACELLEEKGAEIAGQMHISKVQPAVHQALMAP